MDQDYKTYMKLENQLCFKLYAASRMVTSTYTQFLKPLGLTYTQYIVLLVLWEKDGITVGKLCEKLYLDNGTITPVRIFESDTCSFNCIRNRINGLVLSDDNFFQIISQEQIFL